MYAHLTGIYLPQRRRSMLARWLTTGILAISLLGIGLPAAAETNLITNGSFEEGVDVVGDFIRVPAGSRDITGWKVITNDIDLKYRHNQASDGQYSVDLTGSMSTGSIGQVFTVEVGKQYQLWFDMAGNTNCGDRIKFLNVSVASESQDFYFDTAGHNLTQMGWTEKSLVFTATKPRTLLTFTGINKSD